MQKVVAIVVASLLVMVVCSVPIASVEIRTTAQEDTVSKQMTDPVGVEYVLLFNEKQRQLRIEAYNPTNQSHQTGVTTTVDNRTLNDANFRLSPGENWSTTVDIRPGLDALKSEHVVQASTYGATRKFEFDYAIDAQNSTEVPTPYIANTTVSEGIVDGSRSTVVNVTIVNPSEQLYPTKLMVHTQGTDGSLYLPTALSGEKTTVAVELLDSSDSVVVGQARLYANDLNDSSGGIDQVGFKGRVDGNTTTWNESYTAIEGPWSDDAYTYQNGSVDEPGLAERVSDGREVNGVPLVFPAIAAIVVILVGVVVVRRR